MNNNKGIFAGIVRAAKMLFLGGVVAMTCSCNDFLTILPTDKIVLEDFWKTKEDVENVVAESYRLMTQWDFTSRLLVWGELRGDNVIEGNNAGYDIKNIIEANLLPTNEYASWAPFYKVINNCNIVLEYAPDVINIDPNFTVGDLNVVCGQMLAIRALCHFYLVRTFRDVPLLLEAKVNDSQELYQDQADPIEVLDSCLSDLYKAEELVLTSGNYTAMQDNRGRITKDAVRAIIADVCLWKAAFLAYKAEGNDSQSQEWYDKCIEYCDLVLDARMQYLKTELVDKPSDDIAPLDSFPVMYPSETRGYLIEPVGNTGRFSSNYPYISLFGRGCNNIYESIFEIQHATRSETGNFEVPYFYGYSDNETTFKVGVLAASNNIAVEGNAIDDGVYMRSDVRRVNYIKSQAKAGETIDKYGIVKYGYSASKEDHTDVSEYNIGYITYTFLESNSSGGKQYYSNNQVNWIVYRITDVMLMKAEALAWRSASSAQDLKEAFKLVKTVYNRSQTGYVDADGTSIGVKFAVDGKDILKQDSYIKEVSKLRTLVLQERRRELAFEGKRWYDLVRMALRDGKTDNMLSILINNKYTSNQAEYKMKLSDMNTLFFPIAEREINVSNGHLKQNEAYLTADKFKTN